MRIAIITARGGSKRIPGKNIRPFCGKPMLCWPLEIACKTELFDAIYVSTDDTHIAAVAKAHGALVPCMRPAELADDMASARIAAAHMLRWVIDNVGEVSSFAHIYPTAPFLQAEDLHRGSNLIDAGKNFAYTAKKVDFPFFQAVYLDDAGSPRFIFPMEKVMMRSQDMPVAYIDAGQLYWHSTKAFLAEDRTCGALIEIPAWRAIDIDTEDDWKQAESLAFTMFTDKAIQEGVDR